MDKLDIDSLTDGIEDSVPSQQFHSLDDASKADKKKSPLSKADADKIVKAVENLTNSARQMEDIGQDFCALFATDTGELRDFTDKVGRASLRKALDNHTKALNDFKQSSSDMLWGHEDSIKDLCGKTLKAFPQSIATNFCKEDRDRLDFFQDRLRKYGVYVITASIFVGILLGVSIALIIKNANRTKELETWREENAVMIEFGNDMRRYNPKTWTYWQQERAKNGHSKNGQVEK